MDIKKFGLILGPLLFVIIRYIIPFEDLKVEAVTVLAITSWLAVWWILEVLHLGVTSLLPVILFPLFGALDAKTTSAAYGDQFVFLYMGGFIIALSIEKWNLHKRIALRIIRLIGTDLNKMVLGFMIATAFLSMWISNTATAVMMLPIGLAIVSQLKDDNATEVNEHDNFAKVLVLGIAYAASIGGMATLVGTPPNLVFTGLVKKMFGVEISFIQWFSFGFPIAALLLYMCWKYLTGYVLKFSIKEFPGGKEEVESQYKALGPITIEESRVLIVFVVTALAWIFRKYLITPFIPAVDDTMIAMLAAIILFLIPSSQKGKALMDWPTAVKMPWSVIYLFGGGLAIAEGFEQTGLASWFALQMNGLNGLSIAVILLIVIALVNFLTEVTSNLATTAMLLPVLAAMSVSLSIHPFLLMVGATLAASCAFMLPVATPPNAVIFASGKIKVLDMVKAGFAMNLISIAIIFLITYFVLPELLGFDPQVHPWKSIK